MIWEKQKVFKNPKILEFKQCGSVNIVKQAGAELGQAQLKLELELCFTSFEICCINLFRLY